MSDTVSNLHGLELNEERFVGLLRNLIGEVEHLQNTGVGTAMSLRKTLPLNTASRCSRRTGRRTAVP